MNKTLNFTKADLLKIKSPEKGFDTYSDTQEKGLKLYVTSKGTKTFFIRKMIKGKDERIIIGTFPDLSVSKARRKVIEVKVLIANDINPNDDTRKKRAEYTLEMLFDEYMERYSKPNKKSWKYDEREIPKFLNHWFKRKLSDISNQEVRKLHELTRARNGLYQANRILERLRGMYSKAIEWGYADFNPTTGVKKYKEVKRDRFLQPKEIKFFFESLEQDENNIAKNYFKMLLFTGARKTNVLAMRWDEIDTDLRIWRIPDTKNGEPLDVPLIDYAFELLNNIERVGAWVFPSETSTNGHFADPKRSWNRIRQRATIMLWEQEDYLSKLIKKAITNIKKYREGKTLPKTIDTTSLYREVTKIAEKENIELPIGLMNLRIHDVRRTLGSYQAITGSSLSIIGRSLGHKSSDATQIYARLHNDPVRESMGRAIDKMYEYKGVSDE